MSQHFPAVDPQGLLEYSVVFTDRAVNHMSALFQDAMREISATLKAVYGGSAAIVLPGGGSFGMEAIARQFAGGKRCLVIRNGWFSYRWTQILDAGAIASHSEVLMARPVEDAAQAPWRPPPVETVEARIAATRPAVVFAPHVETSCGMRLPDDYLRRVAAATHAVGGLFVLDCVASGALWVDMAELGIDVLLTAPQKGWSSTPGAALIVLSPRAEAALEASTSSSFAADLKKWRSILKTYEDGGHAYHATLPTDGLLQLRAAMRETLAFGLAPARAAQEALGQQVRRLLAERGFPSVAAPEVAAAGVVVSYTADPDIANTRKLVALGLQSAAGVPLQCGERADFRSFRLGLFGLDKLKDVDGCVARLRAVLDRL